MNPNYSNNKKTILDIVNTSKSRGTFDPFQSLIKTNTSSKSTKNIPETVKQSQLPYQEIKQLQQPLDRQNLALAKSPNQRVQQDNINNDNMFNKFLEKNNVVNPFSNTNKNKKNIYFVSDKLLELDKNIKMASGSYLITSNRDFTTSRGIKKIIIEEQLTNIAIAKSYKNTSIMNYIIKDIINSVGNYYWINEKGLFRMD